MKRISNNKDINKIVHAMMRQGWFMRSHNRHLRMENEATGKCITISITPSCPHASNNILRDLRRQGVTLCL